MGKLIRRTFLKEKNLLLAITGFVLLVIVRNIVNINIPPLIFTAYFVMCALFFDITKFHSFFIFTLPFKGGLPFHEIMLIVVIIIFVRNNNNIFLRKTIMLPLLLIIIEFMHMFGDYNSIVQFFRWLMYILYLLLFTLIELKNYKNNITVLNCYIYGVLVSSFILLYKTIEVVGLSYILDGKFRLGNLANHLNDGSYFISFNSNELGNYIAIAIAISLVLYHYRKKSSGLVSFEIFLLSCLGALTVSRMFIVSLFFQILLYSVIQLKSSNFKFVMKLGILMLCVYLIILNSSVASSVVNNVIQRFSYHDISNGRVDIFNNYLVHMLKSPFRLLFGYGLQNYHIKTGETFVAHNAIQEILISWGMVGLTVVGLFFYSIISKGLLRERKVKFNLINILPVITLLFVVQSGQLFSSYAKLILVVIVFEGLLINKSCKEETN